MTVPEEEPLPELLAEVLDLADQVVERHITPEHMEARLAEITAAAEFEPKTWTTLIHPACICEWAKATDEPGGYWMTRWVEHCVIHTPRWMEGWKQ